MPPDVCILVCTINMKKCMDKIYMEMMRILCEGSMVRKEMPDRWFMARAKYLSGHLDPTALVLHQYGIAIVAYGFSWKSLRGFRSLRHLPDLNELGLLITGRRHDKDEFGFLMFNEMIVCAGPGFISAFDSIGIPVGYDIDIGELLKLVAEFELLRVIADRRTVKKAKRLEARRLFNEALRKCESLLASCGKSSPLPPAMLLGIMLNMMLKTDLNVNLPYLILVAIGRLKPDFMLEEVSDKLSQLGMEFEWLFPGAEEPERFGRFLRRRRRSRLTLIDVADLLFDKSVFFTLTVDELSDVLNKPPDRVSSSLRGYRVVKRGFVEALLSYAH